MYYGDDDDTNNKRFKFEKKGTNELIIIGINPSSARGVSKNYPVWTDDLTIDRAIAFSTQNWNCTHINFDGFLMLNVCAFSDGTPGNLPTNNLFHDENMKKIKEYLNSKQNISVLLAYGDNIDKRPYLKTNLQDIVDILKEHTPTFYRLGDLTEVKKNPRHIKPMKFEQLPITTSLKKITKNDADKMKLSLF